MKKRMSSLYHSAIFDRLTLKLSGVLRLLFLFCLPSAAFAQYHTHPCIDAVKTLQVTVDGDFMKLPVIDMEGNNELEISFDYLADEEPWLYYRVVHCDADWRIDNLSEMDYVDAFFPMSIDNVKPSFNTFTTYYHFSIGFPNEDVKLKASGNYALLVFDSDNDTDASLRNKHLIAVATFSVSEQMVFARGEVTSNTDIDFHATHQQLNLELGWSSVRMPYLDPVTELKVVARQNRRNETRREITMPTRIESGKVVYEHNKDLIFDAGNVYRRFEFVDEKYATIGIESVEYHAPYYEAYLWTDTARKGKSFRYDRTQAGRFLIRAARVSDVDTEADYFIARFSLDAQGIRKSGDVRISGDFISANAVDNSMVYIEDENIFVKDVLLKQGSYNYLYTIDGNPSPVEGDFYETENEYDIYIYYRPNGARYDRLMGVGIVR